MKSYVFLGPPGAGKGTMAQWLCQDYGFRHISTGDILREEMKQETALGLEARADIEAGRLIPDEVVTRMVRGRMNHGSAGIVMDGFPRTLNQARLLDDAMSEDGLSIDAAVLFEVDDETILKRLTARRICEQCGALFNLRYHPPKEEGVCDRCGGRLYRRSDDEEETVLNRLKVYREETAPVVSHYEQAGVLLRTDGTVPAPQNYQELRRVLEL
ncbi:MAG: adenylate kinase [Lentisphaeria bacterium]